MRRITRHLALAAIAALWPAMALAADQEAAQRIAAALRSSGQFVDYSIGVKFDNGTAHLLGRVANEQQRKLAVSLVEQMDGVSNVVDNLEIKSSRTAGKANDTGVRFAAAQAPATSKQAANSQQSSQVTANSYNDPGDPLAGQMPRFAPSASRRFASEPAASNAGARPAAYQAQGRMLPASQQAQYAQEIEGPAMPAGANPMSYGFAQPNSFRLAGTAPVNTQAIPTGHQAWRTAGPMYGPSMAGGCVGGPCVGGNCAVPAYEQPNMPCYAWPSYAAYPNYAAVSYPRQYSPTAWPYIGPFYPYPQVPLGWRKVALEWDDGWWWLDFYDNHCHH